MKHIDIINEEEVSERFMMVETLIELLENINFLRTISNSEIKNNWSDIDEQLEASEDMMKNYFFCDN